MVRRELMTQIKWMLLALFISFVLVLFFEGAVSNGSIILKAQNTFLGLNLFLEILIFFAFSTFVVFGTKGFFELYSQRLSNYIVFFSGIILIFVICILCYQILVQE
ncbi:ABC-type transport system involved in multi-copper enzyme maturation permease subunit [Flavobacterium granuli]|uniref:ABC-type transport system involved in multi-copper enzyme maturation permease subunit n=1 Tax=Flavobacterium granuli TaxID=280093 RepID=A0ABU1S6V1_9FLAO|nr:ABC-type transport system involved in multi-copper enzyme maturation permease subunit [Flavobacterium granuli]